MIDKIGTVLTDAHAVVEYSCIWESIENVWQYDIKNNKAELIYPLYAVKSVCNSADGVLMLYPTTEWWSDGLINEKGKKLFNIYGAKIYKGRWVMNNTFSYPKEHKPKFE